MNAAQTAPEANIAKAADMERADDQCTGRMVKKMARHHSWERRPGEPVKTYAVFVLYCEMGVNRSHAGLASRLNKPVTRIRRWATEQGWRERVLAYDAYCDGVPLKIRIQEAGRIARLQAREAAKKRERIVEQLASIDPRQMSVLEAIALLELSMRLERDALGIGEESFRRKRNLNDLRLSNWLQ